MTAALNGIPLENVVSLRMYEKQTAVRMFGHDLMPEMKAQFPPNTRVQLQAWLIEVDGTIRDYTEDHFGYEMIIDSAG